MTFASTPIASISNRIFAYAIDFFLVTIAVIGSSMAGLYFYLSSVQDLGNSADLESSQPEFILALAPLAITILLFVVLHLYVFFAEAFYGFTVGKKIFKLRVVDATSMGPISKRQAFLRESLRWTVDLGLVLPAIFALSSGGQRQRMGDKAAKTIVIQE